VPAAYFSGIDSFSRGRRMIQQLLISQVIIDNNLRFLQTFNAAHRYQIG
jgi:hypothetical protein